MLLVALLTVVSALPLNTTSPLRRFAFGSCAGHFGLDNAPIWRSVLAKHPEFFMWLGDAVYADTMYLPAMHTYTPLEKWAGKFNAMKGKPGYRELREKVPIIGVWDDHDYGLNNGDSRNVYKKEAQQLYLDFLDEPANSPRRKQEGLQTSYVIGPKGKQVKVILLDVRYFRDPWSYEGDTLGEPQWKWLEKELSTPGDLTFVVSGMQVLTQDRFGVTERFHPKSADRLVRLVAQTPNVVILSGDVHISEAMKTSCYDRPVHEITSSGLTHTAYTQYGAFGVFYNYVVQPSTFNSGRRVFDKSFCLVSIDWQTHHSIVSFTFTDSDGNSLMTEKIVLNEQKRGGRSEYCDMPPLSRALRHWAASLTIFVAPVILHATALVVFLRKWSHSF